MDIKQDIEQKFTSIFGNVDLPLIVRSPGRINIIGEHTDYNEGFVLPAAIDKAIYVAVGKNDDGKINLFSVSFNEMYTCLISDVQPTKTWATYVLGVVDQLIKSGFSIGGFNLVLDGDVPLGAGLSSSAAVECATVFALNELFSLGIGKMGMVRIAQRAEQVFAGVMCGIMDQFASMMGKKNHLLKLDCRSLEYEYIPINLQDYKIVLLNTNVSHSLSSSAYNNRRQECEQGVTWIKKHHHEVKSLRDVNMEMLKKYVEPRDSIVYNRCRYVVEEKERLLSGCRFLQEGNLVALGKKMFKTHEGLKTDYGVSCPELDYLIDEVKDNPNVIGARMMGGGFGGCTINLIKDRSISKIVEDIGGRYEERTGLRLSAYVTNIEDGTSILKNKN